MRNLSIIIVVSFLGIISCNQDDDIELPHKKAIDIENVFYHKEGNPPNIPCSTKLSIHKIEGHMFSNNRYVESKMKFKVPLFEEWNGDQKIFAKTTSFRKKNGKWKKFRANIYAGFYGQLTGYDNCNVFTLTPEGKTKKRKKLKMKKYYVNRSRIQDNNLYAKAMQDGNQVSFDYWD